MGMLHRKIGLLASVSFSGITEPHLQRKWKVKEEDFITVNWSN